MLLLLHNTAWQAAHSVPQSRFLTHKELEEQISNMQFDQF